MSLIRVPTVNDYTSDFYALFKIWEIAQSDPSHVAFDFSNCIFLRHNAIAFIGGLIRSIQFARGRAEVKWETLRPRIRQLLERNGFIQHFPPPGYSSSGTPRSASSIPYREDISENRDGIMGYLKQEWLGTEWIQQHISADGRNAIVGAAWEIYANAFEHSSTRIGVFSCGQYYPKTRLLKLTVVDFGVGIPKNVRSFFNDVEIAPAAALEWAFKSGTTTKPERDCRGVGLDILKGLVAINGGRMEIFSHDAYGVIDERGEIYSRCTSHFDGTLVNITLKCHGDCHYYLISEEIRKPLF